MKKKSIKLGVALLTTTSLMTAQELTKEENNVTPRKVTAADYKSTFPSALGVGEIGKIGNNANITVGENQVFLNNVDTNKLIMSFGNPSTSYTGGINALDDTYTITFQFSPIGYVKDNEEIDAEAIMKSFKDSDSAQNEARAKAGLDSLTTIGWSHKPSYNPQTNNLEYGIIFRSGDGQETVNYTIKVLGRKGVTNATLLCDPSGVESLIPTFSKTISSFQYTDGHKYSEFTKGDKLAEYGLNGLIAGGAALALFKFGPKIWKLIIFGAIAIGAFFLKIKNKIFKKSN